MNKSKNVENLKAYSFKCNNEVKDLYKKWSQCYSQHTISSFFNSALISFLKENKDKALPMFNDNDKKKVLRIIQDFKELDLK